jgi:PAS domain S-box-containing protein
MAQPYKTYFDSLPCYVTVQDRNHRILDASRRFREDFGDPEGRSCYQVFKRRAEQCEVCPVERTFVDGRPHQSEERVRALDGRDVSVMIHTTPILDDNGEVAAVMKLSTDVTEMKQVLQQVRHSRKRYQLLFEEVPCFISIQDEDLKIVDANRRFREAFGTFLGCDCFSVYKHRDKECVDCPVRKSMKDGRIHSSEEVVTSRDGRTINTLVYTAPIRDADGNISRVMEMSADITPIRELQSQLESTGLLISSVSHGIKGMLTGMDGGIYLVDSGLKKDNKQRIEKGWAMVQRNVERIRSMVLNILYYAKERVPALEPIQASEIVGEVCDILQPRVEETGVALDRDVPPEAGELQADPEALRALLVNLLENSLDACRLDKKKDDHRVTIGAAGDDGHVTFTVSDNGIGMDRETCDKAFSLFFSSKGSEGTGLGLFIADKIARAHGGEIRLESEVEKGTRFVVTLPRKPSPERPSEGEGDDAEGARGTEEER